MLKKILRISGIILAAILFLLLISVLIVQWSGPGLVLNVLKDRVEKETKGRYTLVMDSLDFNVWNMSVYIGELNMERDTTVDAYSGIPLLDKFDAEFSYSSMEVNYFNLLRFVFYNTIKVSTFRMREPRAVLVKNRAYNASEVPIQDTLANAPPSTQKLDSLHLDSLLVDTLTYRELKESGSVFFPTIIVEDFLIDNASFHVYDGVKNRPVLALEGISLSLNDVHSEKDAPFSAEDLSIEVDRAATLVGKNTAKLELSGLFINPDTFRIDSLHYGHIIDRYRVNRIKGFRSNWLDVQVKDIELHGVHYESMIADSALIVDRVTINDVWLNLFKDKSQRRINPAHKPLPGEQIRSIPLPIEIDTIELVHANLHVEMQAAKAHSPGYININDTYLLITNLTNLPEALERNRIMELFIETNINNAGPVMADFKFDLLSKEDKYDAYVEAGPMDLTVINNFIGSQFFIQFKSGFVDKMVMEYEGNNKANVGQMDLEYHYLKVQKLQNFEQFLDGHPHTGFFAGVGNMLVPKNRSMLKKKYKPGVIYYEKEYNRDFVHGLIQALLSGVTSSVGLTTKNLEKRQDQAEELTAEDTQKAAEKAQQQLERANRKQQKAEARAKKKAEREARKGKKKEGR